MSSSSRSRRLADTLALLERRRRLLRTVVVAVVLLGLVLTAVAPGIVPSTPLVGALVGVVALVLGVLAVLAADAADATVRGPRQVAAIGDLVAVLPTTADPDATGGLADAILEARTSHRLVLGLTGAGRGIDVVAWADALGVALAERDVSVLIVDVASGPTPQAGLVEVVRGGATLARTVTFERDIKLARLGAGRDLDGALQAAAVLPTHLPKDLEVLLVALPPLADGDVLAAAGALDTVFLVARSDATSKVRLQGGVEALEKVGTLPQLLLLDDRAAAPLAPQAAPAEEHGEAPPPAASVDGEATTDAPAATVPPLPTGATSGAAPEEAPDAVPEEPSGAVDQAPPGTAPELDGRVEVPPEPVAQEHEPAPERDPARPEEEEDAPEGPTVEPADATEPSDPWEGPHRATPRTELERRPSPSVRLVRELPSPPSHPTPASEAVEPAAAAPVPETTIAASPRDPGVVEGAAAARLAEQLRVATPPDEVATDRIRRDPQVVSAPAPVATPQDAPVEEVVADEDDPVEDDDPTADAPAEDAPAEDAPAEDDPTDEIPAVRDARLGPPEPEDDPLRTTARLAILMDELHERDDGAS